MAHSAKGDDLTIEQKRVAANRWRKRGLSNRLTDGLVSNGYLTLADLRRATDREIIEMIGVGTKGRMEIYRLLGRKLPDQSRSVPKARAQFEQEWRLRLGSGRFEVLCDLIAEMAGNALARLNAVAAQALWTIARQRRAGKKQ